MDNISPLDSRYKNKCNLVRQFFSYYEWVRFRVYVELKYYKFLIETLTKSYPEQYKMEDFNIEYYEKFLTSTDNFTNEFCFIKHYN